MKRLSIHNVRLGVLMLLVASALASCHQRELFDENDLSYSIKVRATWDMNIRHTFNGSNPEGLRVTVYTGSSSDVRNIPAEGGIVPMREGSHSLLFYNNDTEYIVFNDISSSMNATATTRTRTRSTYTGSPYVKTASRQSGGERTVNQPDFLWGSYIDHYDAKMELVAPEVPVTMHPLVCNYLIRYNFSHGAEYVVLARGALAGMAESVYLNDGHTGAEIATVLFDIDAPRERQADDQTLSVLVNTFGAPNYPNPDYNTRSDATYGLNLEVRTKCGKILSFDFDITDQVKSQPRGGVIDVNDIFISDEDGRGASGGGFDVSVEGWGEYEDIPVEFPTYDN